MILHLTFIIRKTDNFKIKTNKQIQKQKVQLGFWGFGVLHPVDVCALEGSHE